MRATTLIRLLLATFSGICFPALGQSWVAHEVWYGGPNYDVLRGICPASDGGVIVVGQRSDLDGMFPDVYIEHVELNGTTAWSVSADINRMDEFYRVIPANDGGYLAVGAVSQQSDAQWRGLATRLDSDGNMIWSHQDGILGDHRYSAAMADGNGFLVAGHQRGAQFQLSEFVLSRLDSQGEIDWTYTYGGGRDDMVTAMARGVNGDILLAGSTHSFEAVDSDLLLIRLDGEGNDLDYHHEARLLPQTCVDLVADANGYVAAGTVYQADDDERPIPYLMRIDEWGYPTATVVLSSLPRAEIHSMARHPDGSFVLAGQTWEGGHAFAVRVTEAGDLIDMWTSDHSGRDRIEAVTVMDDGTVYFAGSSSSNNAEVVDFYRGTLTSTTVAWPARHPQSPLMYSLWPNPFNDQFVLTAQLPSSGTLNVRMYDLLGRQVAAITQGRFQPGVHRFQIGTGHLATGMYIVETRFDGHPARTLKAMLLK